LVSRWVCRRGDEQRQYKYIPYSNKFQEILLVLTILLGASRVVITTTSVAGRSFPLLAPKTPV
jgi:hypothetical protein